MIATLPAILERLLHPLHPFLLLLPRLLPHPRLHPHLLAEAIALIIAAMELMHAHFVVNIIVTL